ncbi:hypothetical protein CDAR_39671 [Caerostris darwini]|uniref:Uncharacterized protein n=1 Tax=Caerostris darwini TaxID=1538125 RepID=A0AAV4U6F3_9ARAC|nr:hypothetical protein CDAR_39671 [Caerostris darwini]
MPPAIVSVEPRTHLRPPGESDPPGPIRQTHRLTIKAPAARCERIVLRSFATPLTLQKIPCDTQCSLTWHRRVYAVCSLQLHVTLWRSVGLRDG